MGLMGVAWIGSGVLSSCHGYSGCFDHLFIHVPNPFPLIFAIDGS